MMRLRKTGFVGSAIRMSSEVRFNTVSYRSKTEGSAWSNKRRGYSLRIPIHPALQALLDKGPPDRLT
jgi:hypothetical protein